MWTGFDNGLQWGLKIVGKVTALFHAGDARTSARSVTPLYFYNTLGKEKQLFTMPPNVRSVRMYNCGPTVYDRQHVGNLSAAVFGDLIRRTLQLNGYSVKQVINITDFGHLVSDGDEGEDKMSKGLKREKLSFTMANMRDFATKYMNLYLEDVAALNVATSEITFPRASDYVPAMVAMIKSLEEKGYAYAAADGVYFDTKQFPSYGELGGIDLHEHKEETATKSSKGTSMTKGQRVATNVLKRNPTDFAIWKNSSNKKIGWDSPWGKGFPGWHIECSAMINAVLGKQIDIHTGGIEHISIHHNNEIAQSEAATGKQPFSRFWMHRAHIQMGGAKLAKSTGNTAYLTDFPEHNIHPFALRYWFLTSHYRTPSNFTWEALTGAQHALVRLHQRMNEVRAEDEIVAPGEFVTAFTERVNDDLDTAGALALVWESLKNTDYTPAQLKAILLLADTVFAVGLTTPPKDLIALSKKPATVAATTLSLELQTMLETRERARADKNWAEADLVRDAFLEAGYTLKDGPNGQEIFKA